MEIKAVAKKYWWAIALVIILVIVAVWYFFFKDKTPTGFNGNTPGGAGNSGGSAGAVAPFYASKATKDLITAQKSAGKLEDYAIGLGGSQWRWDVFCAQCAQVFGNEWAGCNWENTTGKPINGAKVLAWFHGMNVNPITGNYDTTTETGYNGLFRNAGVVADIKKFLAETYNTDASKIYDSNGNFIAQPGWFLDKIK